MTTVVAHTRVTVPLGVPVVPKGRITKVSAPSEAAEGKQFYVFVTFVNDADQEWRYSLYYKVTGVGSGIVHREGWGTQGQLCAPGVPMGFQAPPTGLPFVMPNESVYIDLSIYGSDDVVAETRVSVHLAGEILAHNVKGYALSFPLPPGPVETEVTVNAAIYKTPFEEEILEGTRLFKATWNEQTLEEEVTVDKDLTVLFLFDPLGVLSRVIVLPTAPLPELPIPT